MREHSSRQIKILIIDDEKSVADILRDLLSDNERLIDACYDGLAGIERIQKNFYDLIIVDLVMPKVGGLDILRYAKKANPHALVIIITGHASLETALSAIKAGAYDYIRKPCKLEEIRIVVKNAEDKILLYKENRELIKKLQDAYNELMVYKQKRDDDKKNASINFFSSNTSGLHYLYSDSLSSNHYIEKMQALSYLKDSGNLTEEEFKVFKRNLIKMIDHEQ